MAEETKVPQWMILIAALGGGGVIGGGGTSILNQTDEGFIQRIESLENQIKNMQETDSNIWKTKASKEYVTLKIQALCK